MIRLHRTQGGPGSGLLAAIEPSPLNRSVGGLRRDHPEMSAHTVLVAWQRRVLLGLVGLATLGAAVAPAGTAIALIAVFTAAYLFVMGYNALLLRATLRNPRVLCVGDEEALAVADRDLPRYTVMIAAYHEAAVIARTLRSVAALDYPRDRLEVKLLLEADDTETIAAALAAQPGPEVEIVRVPVASPRTKPKALNYGLALSAGELVTVYDAEDMPEPLQLRRAAVALARADESVACLQAQLYYHNQDQNLLTRLFAAEYASWFATALPAMAELGAPLPLGGTSMHVRRDALERIGGWDPHNVTEDADLGIRLRRMGFRTEVLGSVTLEEANSDPVNWVKQRSRWYKGYIQTWLVHMREPRRVWRELGGRGVAGLAAVVAGTPLLSLLNPLFWLLTAVWLVGGTAVRELYPAWLYYPAVLSLVLGNFLALYRIAVSVRSSGHPELLSAVLLWPAYWVWMSVAAVRAVAQLTIAPWFWEKTVHGLEHLAGAG